MKLTYFNVRGRGEATRLMFKLAGKDFIDHRTGGEDWQKLKPSKFLVDRQLLNALFDMSYQKYEKWK